MLQSIMNIVASKILLPRVNGENLLGGTGVLKELLARLFHLSRPS